MKNIVVVLALLMFGCESETPQPALVGTWKWVITQGGIAGLTIKPDESNQKKLVFDKDGNMTFVVNGKNTQTIKYEAKTGKSITSTEQVPLIVFPGEESMNWSYSIDGDSLYLFEEVYDGFGHTYVREK
ncbi:MAG: hypothetical protein IPP61_01525 [Cytophagaceae bacterium]|nr:hypothetical protein [Cytophagaceae bacterium]MBL0301033.1 hypothetical protein [Cytophagaceae bacterium]MBL0323853.1 hypothetical protein [Cytophagaceae bacterium]